MKITYLKPFSFEIGNTTDGEDVVATNDGIMVGNKLGAEYDNEADINDADDLIDLIDEAIVNCENLCQDDKDELGTYLGADIDIIGWWKIIYGE